MNLPNCECIAEDFLYQNRRDDTLYHWNKGLKYLAKCKQKNKKPESSPETVEKVLKMWTKIYFSH
jgi:hypothetical protein